MYPDELEAIQYSLLLMSSSQDKFNTYLVSHAAFCLICAMRRLAYSFTVLTYVLPKHCAENSKTFEGLLLPSFCPGKNLLSKCTTS